MRTEEILALGKPDPDDRAFDNVVYGPVNYAHALLEYERAKLRSIGLKDYKDAD